MPTTVTMPQLGETVVEGTILKWLKQEGEEIGLDEPLFEISTDKVDTEVPSPVAGTVKEIKVQEGETVSVGTELAVIDDGSKGEQKAEVSQEAAEEREAAPRRLEAVPERRVLGEPEEAVPMTHIRKAIAKNMVASLQTTARAWNLVEVNMENIARIRERAKDAFKQREGFSLTF